MRNKLICTRADNNIKDMTDITHPIMKEYAEKCDADFLALVVDTDLPQRMPEQHFRILKFYDLFDKYDRILGMDSDILISPHCPNIFDVVPEDKIGSVLEDKGSRQNHRRDLIRQVQAKRQDVGWTEGYINTGVSVFSKMHRELFNVDKNNLWMEFGQDCVEIGYQIHRLGFEVYELDPKYNAMSMWMEPWYGLKKSDAYVLHYAGRAYNPQMPKIDQIKQDKILFIDRAKYVNNY